MPERNKIVAKHLNRAVDEVARKMPSFDLLKPPHLGYYGSRAINDVRALHVVVNQRGLAIRAPLAPGQHPEIVRPSRMIPSYPLPPSMDRPHGERMRLLQTMLFLRDADGHYGLRVDTHRWPLEARGIAEEVMALGAIARRVKPLAGEILGGHISDVFDAERGVFMRTGTHIVTAPKEPWYAIAQEQAPEELTIMPLRAARHIISAVGAGVELLADYPSPEVWIPHVVGASVFGELR